MNASTLNQGTGQEPSCPPGSSASLTADDGVAFLRRQQASLLRSLQDADGSGAGKAPAGKTAHSRWLALIAAVDALHGPEAAHHVARLYEYHGRVAGSLAREQDLPLDPSAARHLHRLLGVRLSQLTDDAVAALRPPR